MRHAARFLIAVSGALTVFEFHGPHSLLGSVTVGVVDTGLDSSAGEFATADALCLKNIAGPPSDINDDLRGTAASGVADSFVPGLDALEGLDTGLAVAGNVTLDGCRIDERSPFDGIDPWIITVTGACEGVLEMVPWGGRDPTLHDFDGHFSWPMLVSVEGEETINSLETICEGGIPRDRDSESSPETAGYQANQTRKWGL